MTDSDAALDRLVAADRLAVAADLLVAVFTTGVDLPLPRVTIVELSRTLAQRHGVDFRKRRGWAGLPSAPSDGVVLRIALDVAHAWAAARLAFPVGGGENDGATQLALSLVGQRALRQADPESAVAGVLAELGGSRSFVG